MYSSHGQSLTASIRNECQSCKLWWCTKETNVRCHLEPWSEYGLRTNIPIDQPPPLCLCYSTGCFRSDVPLEPSLHDCTSMPVHCWYAVHVSIEFLQLPSVVCLWRGLPFKPLCLYWACSTDVLVNFLSHSFPVLCNSLSYVCTTYV